MHRNTRERNNACRGSQDERLAVKRPERAHVNRVIDKISATATLAADQH